MAMLDSTVANLALESIRAGFSATLAEIQWIATAYLIALAVSLPAVGWLGTRCGYGRVWGSSLLVFTIASALCALAPSPASLIVARVVQGLAAGLLVPAGQAVIGAIAGPGQLGRIFGLLGLVISLGPAIGPALGGFFLEVGSWRWLFWINVPIGAAMLVAARGLVPDGEPGRERPLDVRGLVLLALGLTQLLYAASRVASVGMDAVATAFLAFGTFLLVAFTVVTLGAPIPIIDLRLLACRAFGTPAAIAGLTGANMYGGLLLIPLYLQLGIGVSAEEAGMLLLAMGLGSAVALPLAGALTDRHGAGPVLLGGAALLVGTTVPFLMANKPSTAALALVLVVRGIGLAWAQMPAMTAAYAAVSADQMGDAATIVNIVQRVGGALGAAGVVILVADAPVAAGPGDDAGAYSPGFALLGVVAALTVIGGLIHRRRRAIHGARVDP
jgi:EmrB/QacA subfamily drug resistance transporter